MLKWLEDHEAVTTVDPIVMGEISRGILMLPQGRKRASLHPWFGLLRRNVPCTTWTMETRWFGQKSVFIQRSGFTLAAPDTMIAATAKLYSLTVATRNVDDFTRCGVVGVNPFE